MRSGIDGRDPRSAKKIYIVLRIPVGRPDIPAVEFLLRPQVSLGQRRATKRDARFLADDHDPPAETLLPKGRGGIAPRDATAGHDDRTPADSLRHKVHSAFEVPARTVGTGTSRGRHGMAADPEIPVGRARGVAWCSTSFRRRRVVTLDEVHARRDKLKAPPTNTSSWQFIAPGHGLLVIGGAETVLGRGDQRPWRPEMPGTQIRM